MIPKFNSQGNICCWNCQHYQRYDDGIPPLKCDGECRARPIKAALFVMDHRRDVNMETVLTLPYITDGLRHRCHRFEKSDEEKLPTSPMSKACTEQPPQIPMQWVPWSKWDFSNCWNCLYFEPEQGQHKQQLDTGSCMYNPPACMRQNIPSLVPRTTIGTLPTIPKARALWCSCWKQREHQIEYTSIENEPPHTVDEYFNQWEERHERLVWMSALIKAIIDKMRSKPPEDAQDPPQDPQKG